MNGKLFFKRSKSKLFLSVNKKRMIKPKRTIRTKFLLLRPNRKVSRTEDRGKNERSKVKIGQPLCHDTLEDSFVETEGSGRYDCGRVAIDPDARKSPTTPYATTQRRRPKRGPGEDEIR